METSKYPTFAAALENFDGILDEYNPITLQEMDGVANPEDFGEWMDFSLKTKWDLCITCVVLSPSSVKK